MTTFDEREDGFEKKFAHDEALKFKAQARRNRLLGLWAADKLGKPKEAAAAYAKEIVTTGLAASSDGSVLRKVAADLAGLGTPETEIRNKMLELLAVAVAQIQSE